jgi:uncharacterized membrane protein YfcA
MEISVTAIELIELIVALVLSGALTGVLAGLFGVGGGAVIIPVLYEAYAILGLSEDVRMHVCVGTAMAIIVPTAIRSFMAHHKRGSVDMAVVKSWLIPMPIGVAAAAILAASISGRALSGVFATIVALVAVRLLFGRESWRLGEDLPGNPLRAVIGVVIGFLSTLMGVGGGIMVNTVMTLYGRKMIQAVGTSSAIGLVISIPAVIGYVWAGWGVAGLPPLSIGYVNLLGMAILVPVSVFAAPYGVRIAHSLSQRTLEMAFGSFLGLVAIRFFFVFF